MPKHKTNVEASLGLAGLWNISTILENLSQWLCCKELKIYKSVPFLVSWRLWIARNDVLFEDKYVPSFQVAAQALSILHHFQKISKVPAPTVSRPPRNRRSRACGFFDGASQLNGENCSAGYVIILKGKCSLVRGPITWASSQPCSFELLITKVWTLYRYLETLRSPLDGCRGETKFNERGSSTWPLIWEYCPTHLTKSPLSIFIDNIMYRLIHFLKLV